MTIDDVSNILGFLGGLGMFLYGMKLLSGGLQKAAGEKMKSLLEAVTNKRIKAILVGALVTAIIQSSGATTVMIVGFVNAGILNLMQAVGVIMGANIGTTVTAWIVSLDSLGEAATFFKPSFYAPLMIGVGAAFIMFCKNIKTDTRRNYNSNRFPLFGLTTMSSSMSDYMAGEAVKNMFLTLGSNPLFGILIGIVVTGVMQSSSASVGVLQTLSGFGVVNAPTAVFICLGADIGSCFTALISSAGVSKNAKRAAVINLLFNTFGVIIWGTLIFIIFKIFPGLEGYIMSAVSIAIFHSGFKVVNTTLFYPIAGKLVDLSKLIIRDKEETQAPSVKVEKDTTMLLDDRILNTPSLAIQAVSNYVIKLGKICSENLKRSLDAIMYNKYELIDVVFETEKHIDDHVANLSDFLVKISNDGLTDRQSRQVKDLMYTVIDLERVGDHAENLAELAGKLRDGNMKFSEVGVDDLKLMRAAVESSIDSAVAARETGNIDMVRKTFRYEDEVDSLEEEIRDKHIERLSKRECNSETGVIFLNILTNLERVSDHAINIAGYVKDEA